MKIKRPLFSTSPDPTILDFINNAVRIFFEVSIPIQVLFKYKSFIRVQSIEVESDFCCCELFIECNFEDANMFPII